MSKDVNHFGQPMGFAVPGWNERQRPPRTAMKGRFCSVLPLEPERHAADLYAANSEYKDLFGLRPIFKF